jgi:hypothetical protein
MSNGGRAPDLQNPALLGAIQGRFQKSLEKMRAFGNKESPVLNG